MLSQDEYNIFPLMQQRTKKSQTIYLIFRIVYLIHISLKKILNNFGNILKIHIWKIYVMNMLSQHESS